MPGSNLNYSTQSQIGCRVAELLGYAPTTLKFSNSGKLCTKAGVPAANTANDAPIAKGDICLDVTNSHVYISTLYTNTTTHTWTQVDA